MANNKQSLNECWMRVWFNIDHEFHPIIQVITWIQKTSWLAMVTRQGKQIKREFLRIISILSNN